MNNKWCLVRFSALVKHLNLSIFRKRYNTAKIFIFTCLFMRFNFAFCCERIKAIQTIKITIVFGDIFLNNADYFFIER